MARKRLRENWKQIVRKYWIKPEIVPQSVYEEAERMRSLWNKLVEIGKNNKIAYDAIMREDVQYNAISDAYKLAEKEFKEAGEEIKRMRQTLQSKKSEVLDVLHQAKKEKKEILVSLGQKLKTKRKELKIEKDESIKGLYDLMAVQKAEALANTPGIYWSNAEAVMNAFETAWRVSLKKGDELRFHKRNGHIRFVHRYTGGGIDPARIFNGRSGRFHIDPLPGDAFDFSVSQRERKRRARTRGSFRVNGDDILFKTIIHRSLPEGAILKQAVIVKNRVANQDKWHICLTLEIPPYEEPKKNGKVVRIEINDDLNKDKRSVMASMLSGPVATITDSEGKTSSIVLSQKIARHVLKLKTLQQNSDSEIQNMKEKIARAIGDDESFADLMERFGQAGRSRVWRIVRRLEETGEYAGLLENLLESERQERFWYHSRAGLERRTVLSRDHLYHNKVCEILRAIPGGTVVMNDRPRNKYLSKTLAAPGRIRDLVEEKAGRYGVTVEYEKVN